MSKNSFDRIINWPYHPQMIIAIGFACSYAATMQGDGPIWAGLIVAAFVGPWIGLLVFLPYIASVWMLAVLASLLQAIRPRLLNPR